MKPIALALVVTLAGLGATAARADYSHVSVDFGIAARPNYTAPAYYPPGTTIIAPAPRYDYAPVAGGHWENVSVKTWVPGRWVVTRDRWGRSYRSFENGYYAFRTERVWVDGRHERDHDRDRDHSYGYNGGWNR
ncbi:MAG TPA: hypothetical protein VHD62_01110 [Opitutaceae bacterium]|nr:hypothetical protein [Opitutaceae bacterium]